jgi:hypothetical protein
MSITIPSFDVKVHMPVPLMYVYRIGNQITGKSYIGQTNNIERRIMEHLSGKGSPLLLVDLVKQNLKEFDFEVLEVIYTGNTDVNDLEDKYIKSYDSLAPNGYNQCLNAPITPESSDTELLSDELEITGKYVYSAPTYHVFTIGEHTQARSYQSLANLKQRIDSNMLIKRTKGKFRYYELRVESDRQFVKKNAYTLQLNYNEDEDAFTA